MTQDEIIEMAIQAGIPSANVPSLAFGRVETGIELLESFAKLVAAKEREIQGAAFEKILESIRRSERAEEREACAVIAETPIIGEQDDITMEAKNRVAKAIRARGQA